MGGLLAACSPSNDPEPGSTTVPDAPSTFRNEISTEAALAEVIAVETAPQDSDSYRFSVTVKSPDTGCEQYADWWEVLTPEGTLIYRRILAHSHVDEQPFERSGGPVTIGETEMVLVRAHMHPAGYGNQAMKGTVSEGFETIELPDGFAADLADAQLQPGDCAF